MAPIPLDRLAAHLDATLRTAELPDYPGAQNGVQLANRAPIRKVACAVDFSRAAVERCIAEEANLLVVHHGMFWGGVQRLTGNVYERLALLFAHDVAVYASHLPLDAHPSLGNNVLLARELRLHPTGTFARYQTLDVGVRGESEITTLELARRADNFSVKWGHMLVAPEVPADRMTKRWAICSGAGASSDTLREAAAGGIDTLIVGEGPHHTEVEARELGIVVLRAGHYATETPGVRALGTHIEETFGIPWTFLHLPTGT